MMWQCSSGHDEDPSYLLHTLDRAQNHTDKSSTFYPCMRETRVLVMAETYVHSFIDGVSECIIIIYS